MAFPYLLAEKFSSPTMFSMKEFAIVSNLRFISRKNFMLSWVEHEKSLLTSGPDIGLQKDYPQLSMGELLIFHRGPEMQSSRATHESTYMNSRIRVNVMFNTELLCLLSKYFSRQHNEIFFPEKKGFDILWKLSPLETMYGNNVYKMSNPLLMETICIECKILFPRKNKKNIISFSSAEWAQSMVKVKKTSIIVQIWSTRAPPSGALYAHGK